jgi:hypothetical protein
MKKVDSAKSGLKARLGAGKKKSTKEAQRAQGFNWQLFEQAAEDESLAVAEVKACAMLFPFIEHIKVHIDAWLASNLSHKNLLMPNTELMRAVYLGIEKNEPSDRFLVSLKSAGHFAILRTAAGHIARGEKMNHMRKIYNQWRAAVTATSIAEGKVFTVEDLYEPMSAPWGPIVFAEYGINNRGHENEPFRLPALAQHNLAWSKIERIQNLTSGVIVRKPVLGGPILENIIEALGGENLALDTLSVYIAYCMAKEYGINLNHGFNLALAAREWKAWCARPCVPAPSLRCAHSLTHPSNLPCVCQGPRQDNAQEGCHRLHHQELPPQPEG